MSSVLAIRCCRVSARFASPDVAVKALSGDLESGPAGLLSPWSVIIVSDAVFSF